MLDPVLAQVSTQAAAASTRLRLARDPILRADVERFNPFVSLVTSDLPESFYPTLSIYSAFSLISCDKTRHNEGLSCVSLDHTTGFIIATQGRYPDSVFYTLYREDWNIERSGVNMEAVMQRALTLEELSLYVLSANSAGVDICFCSTPTMEKLQTAISLVMNGGSLIIWVDEPVSLEWRELLVSSFSRVVVYKPATTSPVLSDLYLVCSGRGRQLAGTLDERVEQLSSQLAFIEEYRERCLQAILARVDNTQNCDPHLAKVRWLGV